MRNCNLSTGYASHSRRDESQRSMIEPIGLRVVELQALVELRQAFASKIEELAASLGDPRTRVQSARLLSPVYREIESIERELVELIVGVSIEGNSPAPARLVA